MLTFLLIVLAGIFVSNVFAEGGKCPTCSNTLSYNYGAWTPYSADKTKHIRTITPYCTNCGLTLTSYPSTPESHKYGEKPRIIIEDKSEPSWESAMNAINLGKAAENYAIEARKFAEKAKQKAESAINSANRAIEHANKTSKQSLKDRANNALERAQNLKNRADDKYPAEQGN